MLEDRTLPNIAIRWAWHYRTLVALRNRLIREANICLDELGTAIEPDSMHPADSASDEFDHDFSLALLARKENALAEINDAITRILEGRYGICEATKTRIPAARLRAVPWCRYARHVEQQLERTSAAPRRTFRQ